MKNLFMVLVLAAALPACQRAETRDHALRLLTADQRAQDFEQLFSLFKAYYGPYQYKEARFGMTIESNWQRLKADALKARTDEEFAGAVMQFGGTLNDGHVQIVIQNTASGVASYSVPIMITPVEGKALIADIAADLAKETEFAAGDEVLTIDGKSPFDYLPAISKYRSTARLDLIPHYIFYALARPSYMADLIPTSPLVRLSVRTATGYVRTIDLPWTNNPYSAARAAAPRKGVLDLSVSLADDLNSVVSHRKQMGQVDPVFLNAKSQAAFKFVKVYPSDAARKEFGLATEEKPPIYAALYRHAGKTILLVRQATYYPTDFKPAVYMKAYMALISEYQPLADVMVLDQTHNPGGNYCADFYNLFARDGDRQAVQQMHADRRWINGLLFDWLEEDNIKPDSWNAKIMAGWADVIEKAMDAGQTTSEPLPIFSGSHFAVRQKANWSKPMLVLIDELAGSCGDMFPMAVKANGRAKLFGQPTMGLGGNVEEVGVLTHSHIKIRLTRGLFHPYTPGRAPQASEYVENNGVLPDLPYAHTVQDFRDGFVAYIKAFSDAAVAEAK